MFILLCEMSFQLCLSLVPLNDKKTLEIRALSFDRDDELGEGGLEEVLKAKKPKDLRKGNLHSTQSICTHFLSNILGSEFRTDSNKHYALKKILFQVLIVEYFLADSIISLHFYQTFFFF